MVFMSQQGVVKTCALKFQIDFSLVLHLVGDGWMGEREIDFGEVCLPVGIFFIYLNFYHFFPLGLCCSKNSR